MTQLRFDHFRPVPESWPDATEQLRKVTLALNGVLRGQTNTTTLVTLTPNATETIFESNRIIAESVLIFSPRSASAAAALPSIWIEATLGQATIHHASSPATDQNFGLVIAQ